MYLKQHKKILIYSGVCYVLIWLFCYLYHLPVSAVIYATAICLLIGALFVGMDVIEAKKKSEKLRAFSSLIHDLEQDLPRITTVEDMEYQRILGQMDEEQSRLKTDLSAEYENMVEYYTIWAHQIKTPIAAMRLKLQNEDSDLVRQLSVDLNRIEQYVEMVMIFLRLDSDSSDYMIREYDLNAIVNQAVRKYASEFIYRKIKLDYRLPEDSIRVITDEKWLCFVIEQILSNALKYTKQGMISVYLEEPETLCIKDTGIGIAPADLPRVFEKGYTGYNGRNDKRASGIGLFLTKKICERLGHVIQMDSKVDEGTIVRIDLHVNRMQLE